MGWYNWIVQSSRTMSSHGLTGRSRNKAGTMINSVEKLEQQLDSFNPPERKEALCTLLKLVESGKIQLPPTGTDINLHFHTFYSYNACGYSPTKIAWLARKTGLKAAGIVDFDVLDALEEFLESAHMLGLKACAGIESRVFVPEFSDKVINSPGEPGIAYHMGTGFPRSIFEDKSEQFKKHLRQIARQRNQELMMRVNKHLSPLELDYEKDVIPLTPSGNATERHICLAYARKARELFSQDTELAAFWLEKLGAQIPDDDLPEGIGLLNVIRKKTMKQGGDGYVLPDACSFPKMADMNRFVLTAGGIPTLTWLDGTSEGEQAIEDLLKIAMSTGVAAINIIPDRNYTPGLGKKDRKCQELYKIVELAKKLHLPVIAGTEMNNPEQKFVDDFKSAELSPLLPVFIKGSHIIYGHSVFQQQSGLGYTSTWADKNFQTRGEKNKFFEKLGEALRVNQEELLKDLPQDIIPDRVLEQIKN